MREVISGAFCALILAIGPSAWAADDGWSGAVTGGYVATSGNSESSAANLKAEAAYTTGRWQHSALASAISGGQKDNSTGLTKGTADSYSAGAKTRYDLAKRYYTFASADWLKDRFSSYDYQLYETIGLGWHALTGPTHTLDIEAGPGARQAKLRAIPPGETDRDQNEAIGLLRGTYKWRISETAAFVQKASVVSGSDNTYIETSSELKAGIVGNIGLVLGYTIKHNSDVLPGVDKTDKFTTVGIEYKF